MHKLLAVLVLSVCLYAQTHTEVTVEDAQTVSGNKTFSGTNTHSGVETFTGSLFANSENKVIWVGPSLSGQTTIEQGLTVTPCLTLTCQLNLTSDFSETVTAPITLGNGTTNLIQLHGLPGANVTTNITSGGNVFNVKSQSAVAGEIPWDASGGSNNHGFFFSYPATANIACFFCTDPTVAGGIGGIRMEDFGLIGDTVGTSTVSTAVMDLAGVDNLSIFRDFYIKHFFNTIGLNVRSTTAGPAGPLVFENVWVDGMYHAGARPWVFSRPSGGFGNGGISIIGGVANHPGAGLAMIEVNGNAETTNVIRGGSITGTYFENTSGGNSIAIKLADTYGWSLSGIPMSLNATDTDVDISEANAGSGRTCAIQVHGIANLVNGATLVNNHITGHTITGTSLPFYNFGGDTACNVAPFTIEDNEVQILGATNNLLFDFFKAGGLQINTSSPATNKHLDLRDLANTASHTVLYSFLDGASGTTLRIDPVPPDGTHDAIIEVGRGVNTNSTRKLNFDKGDGSATVTAFVDYSVGNFSGNQYTSTVATGTAPLVVASTTQVANLNSASCNPCSLTSTNPTFTSSIVITDAAATLRTVNFQTAGVARWFVRANNTAEGGANAGSDFEVVARDDAGAALGNAFTCTRSSQSCTFFQQLKHAGSSTPNAAGATDLGTAALPWGHLYLGTAATNNLIFTPAATAAARTINIADPLATAQLRTEISNTATVDLASVATAACSADSSDVTVTGASVGDTALVTAATALEAGGFLIGRVTASNTARFQFCNLSGGAIDRASDTYKIRVLK